MKYSLYIFDENVYLTCGAISQYCQIKGNIYLS